VVGGGIKRPDRAIAQARLKSCHELRPGQCRGGCAIEQVARDGHERRQLLGHELHTANRRGQLQAFQAQAHQIEPLRGVALGRWRAQGDRCRRAFIVLEADLDRVHAAIACGKEQAQITDQALERKLQTFHRAQFRIELDLRLEAIRGTIARQRIGNAPDEAIQYLDESLAAAACESGTRQVEHLAQGAQSHRGEQRYVGQAGEGKRHASQRLTHGHICADAKAVAASGEHAGCARQWRQCDAVRDTQCNEITA